MDIPLTIKDTQEGLINKKFSAVELVDSYLAKINKYNKELNIFLTVTQDSAYKKAKEVDRILRYSDTEILSEKPLLGVTVAHKDLFLTKGLRTTASSKVLDNFIPTYSATSVKRIYEAGAIMIGKTNHDAWGHGSSGENSDFGPTKNPWNKDYVPGGSSAGSAAALAANMALISTGTDTGSSVRLPAVFSNLFGLKPTYGAVSRYGVIAMASSLDTVGHFARCTDDIKKVFDITRGEDDHDSTVKNIEYLNPKAKMRIGIPKEYFIEGLDPEVKKAVMDAAKIYEKEGLELVDISLPHTKYAISIYYIIMPAEVSSNLGRYDGIRYGNARSSFGNEAKRRIMLGSYVLSAGYYDAYYLKAMKVRSILIREFDSAFENVDAILAPVSPTPPFKLGEKTNDPLQMYLADIFTVSANLAGIPGLAIPSGFTKEGLPLGFQLMGPRFSEYTLFALAEMFEKETGYKPLVANL